MSNTLKDSSRQSSDEAKKLTERLLKSTKVSASGKHNLSPDDVQKLRDVSQQIIDISKQGKRSLWGPCVPEFNALSKVLLPDAQYMQMGRKKTDIAQSLLDFLPPPVPATDTSTNSAKTGSGSESPPEKRIRIDSSEVPAVTAYLQQLRSKGEATKAATSPWDSFIMPPPPNVVTKHSGLSWPCPLLLFRRKQDFTDEAKTVRDLRAQIKDIKSWATIVDYQNGVAMSRLQLRSGELRPLLPELAGFKVPVPASWGDVQVVTAYKQALSSCADSLEAQAHGDTVMPTTPRAPAVVVTRPSAHIPSALSSRAAQTFLAVTERGAQADCSRSNVEDCCFLVSQYEEHRLNLSGALGISIKKKVPQESLAIISRRMAPVGNKLTSASTLFPGSSKEAKREQNAVQTILEDVFQQGNIVALERIKRGSATDRVNRVSRGAQLSKEDREESLSRESRALARIAVLSCMIDRGSSALGKLQVGLQVPSLAEHIASMSGIDAAAATAAAKSSLAAGITQATFLEQEESRAKKSAAATRAVFRNRNNNQNNGGGGGGGRNGGGPGRKKRRRGRRGRNNAKCHRCGKKGHKVANCPQPAPNANSDS